MHDGSVNGRHIVVALIHRFDTRRTGSVVIEQQPFIFAVPHCSISGFDVVDVRNG